MLYKVFNFFSKKSNCEILFFFPFNQRDFQKKLQEGSSGSGRTRPLTLHQELNCGLMLLDASLRDIFMAGDMSSHYMHGVEPLTQVKRASCRSSQNITQKWVTKQISQMKNLNNESNNYQKTIKKHKKRYSTPLRNLKHL